MELLAAAAGLVAGVVLAVLLLRRTAPSAPVPPPAFRPDVPSSVDVIQALPVAVAVLDGNDDVVLANRAALQLGVVRDERVPVTELRRLARDTRRSGTAHEAEV